MIPAVLALTFVAGEAAWTDLIVFPATDFRLIRSEAWPGWLPGTPAIGSFMVNRINSPAPGLVGGGPGKPARFEINGIAHR